MKFIYLIAAHNECEILETLVDKFKTLIDRKIKFELYVIDNASTDNSKLILDGLASVNTWLHPIYINDKGLGVAFKKGLNFIEKQEISPDHWIVFSAADLPFNFTDLDAFLNISKKYHNCELFIGSKFHPESQVERGFKRLAGSYFFYLLRLLVIQLNVKDTQGTIFLKANNLNIFRKITANDYFFTTELIYYMKKKSAIIEMPVIYESSARPSKVNLMLDGFKSFKQLIKLKLRSCRF